MGKCFLRASSFIFDQIIIKVAGNQDRHKSLFEFNFKPNQTTHFGVTCPWVMKISHFWTWISLKPVGQSWSNFMCSIIGVGERLHKVLGQIDLGTLDSGERSLPFGLLVHKYHISIFSVSQADCKNGSSKYFWHSLRWSGYSCQWLPRQLYKWSLHS